MVFKYFSLLLSISLLSCKEDLQPQETSKAIRAEQNTSSTVSNPTQTTNSTPSNNGKNQATGPLNPAHGQPGHRCDIAVGAPLNSNQTTTANQNIGQAQNNVNTQNTQVTPQMTTTVAKTTKGMNPPHGQPGHRCDIAVGQPLNSKPKPTTTNTTNTTGSTTNYSTTPAQSSTPALLSTSATETKPGMNPPHGQPGHVCGIPVGSPLNEATKEVKSE